MYQYYQREVDTVTYFQHLGIFRPNLHLHSDHNIYCH